MNDCRTENFAGMRQALIHSAFESVSLHYAVIFAVQQHDPQDLLMKIPHVEIGPVDRFGAVERSRQGVLSLNNVAYRICAVGFLQDPGNCLP